MPVIKHGYCRALRENPMVYSDAAPQKDTEYAYTYIAKCRKTKEVKIGKAVDPCSRLANIKKDKFGPYTQNDFKLECLVNTGVCEKFLHLVFKKYQTPYNDPFTFQGAYKTEKFALPQWATKNLEITVRATIEVGGFRNNHAEKIPSIKEVRAAVNLTTGSSRSLRSLGTG
ncbi:hypothetical protein [Pseudomonas zhanjiangensis]|uniref:Bacteriophage T5 Orf172 DNA-binding domain-containing protein n=1 Tax=Pseudomonas zhanjiangensis TaxID=3239015 RepID=A0ABV3Z057_9PSED